MTEKYNMSSAAFEPQVHQLILFINMYFSFKIIWSIKWSRIIFTSLDMGDYTLGMVDKIRDLYELGHGFESRAPTVSLFFNSKIFYNLIYISRLPTIARPI